MEYRAAFMSINSMVLRLGQTIGPPLAALVFVNYGYDMTFFASGGLALLTAVVGILYSRIIHIKITS